MHLNPLVLMLLAGLTSCATSRTAYDWPDEGAQQFVFGIHSVDPEADGISTDKALGITLEYTRFLQEYESGRAGLDVLLGYSVHDVSFPRTIPMMPFVETRFEEVTNLKLAVGGRFEIALADERFHPWLRAGLVFQYLYDESIDDSGIGLFVGTGLDFALSEAVAVGPALWYSQTKLDDFDVDELDLGIRIAFAL